MLTARKERETIYSRDTMRRLLAGWGYTVADLPLRCQPDRFLLLPADCRDTHTHVRVSCYDSHDGGRYGVSFVNPIARTEGM